MANYLFSLHILSLLLLFHHVILSYSSKDPDPQNYCGPVHLPSEANFTFPQPVWWNEIYKYESPVNITLKIKIYSTLRANREPILFYTHFECPQPFPPQYTTINYAVRKPLTARVHVIAGQPTFMMVRYAGGTYTIMGCIEKPNEPYLCDWMDVCPQDCNGNGFCNIGNATCECDAGWIGVNCSSSTVPPVYKKLPPFGSSWLVFYSVTLGVPIVLVAIVAIALLSYFFIFRKKASKAKKLPPGYAKLLMDGEISEIDSPHRKNYQSVM